MRKALVGFFCTFTLFSTAQTYKLMWEDNFEGSLLNKEKWTIVEDGKGGGNRELQYYRAENISVGKEPQSGAGCLIITAKKENYRFHRCTSGRLNTNQKMSFKYGKIEAHIKFPRTSDGLWPAFWMLGDDHGIVGWPKCGEVDIVEMGNVEGIKNGTQEKLFNGACHWGEKFNHGRYPNFAKASVNPYSLQDDKFHLFTCEWTSKSIKMYLDRDQHPDVAPYFELPIEGDGSPNHPSRYFNKPFYVIFNLAVGGNFTQVRKTKNVTALANGDAMMYVDFIKIYQQGSPDEEIKIQP